MKNYSLNLVPLSIPQGWAVTYNSFRDVPMLVEDDFITNFDSYKEDLLQIQQLDLKNGRFYIPESGYLLDLGWYPDSDPHGQFQLTIIKGSWDNEIVSYQSKSHEAITQAIEQSLAAYAIIMDNPFVAVAKQLVDERNDITAEFGQ